MKNLLKIMLAASLCMSVSFAAPQKETIKDPRDGKTYKTVKIGDQVWMAENLAFEINEINGNPGSTNDCLILGGNGKKANCKKYGRYYSAMAAATTACPDGWRLPSAAEFKKLLDYTGNSIDLKSKKGWNTYQQPSGNGTDKYGFNAQPSGGCIVAQDAKCAYMDEGKYAYFWTSSMQWNSAEDAILQQSVPEGIAYAFLGAPHADYGFDVAPQKKAISMWYPVRCIQDEKKNVGDGLAGLLSGNANVSEQKKSDDFDEGRCSNSNVLDLTVLLKDDYVAIGARGGFQPNIYFNEMWTFRCKANGQRVTYTAKDVQENLGRGYGPKCPNGKEISPDKYINELEKIELWTIENESVDMLVEDMLMNELSRIYNQFKNLEDAGKITIFIDDKRNHDMKWIKKKYGPILNKIQKLGFKEIYFPSDVESSMRSETENAIYYDTRFVIKYDDAHANQLYKTFGVRKPSEANFAKENKRCHNSLVTIEMKNEQAFKEKMDKAFKDSAVVNKILKDVASKMSKEKDPSESSGGGIGDGLAGLFSGGNGKNATKAIGNIESPSADDVGVTGSIDHEHVMKVVRQRLPGLRHIYNKYLKKKPGFQGKVVLKLDVNANGQVTYISVTSSTANYPEFENEIAEAVSRWKFENSTGNTIITIPCTFKINE
ncbi:TonB family protein [Fibrobacter sp. UBA4297]|uniref:TonB family protein n=1 Tax=Fibrobacter sp. UBA4297 TaxID=1946536 RepID=UPI0025C55F69|nr:TonB family protein [Fibrobacter sp. UBA4297]